MKIGLISPINFSPEIFYRVESSYLRIHVIIDNPSYSIKFSDCPLYVSTRINRISSNSLFKDNIKEQNTYKR